MMAQGTMKNSSTSGGGGAAKNNGVVMFCSENKGFSGGGGGGGIVGGLELAIRIGRVELAATGGGGGGGGNAKCHPDGEVGASRGNTFYCVFCTCGCRPSTTGCSGGSNNATRGIGGGHGGHITVLKIADHNGSITISAKKTMRASGGGGGAGIAPARGNIKDINRPEKRNSGGGDHNGTVVVKVTKV